MTGGLTPRRSFCPFSRRPPSRVPLNHIDTKHQHERRGKHHDGNRCGGGSFVVEQLLNNFDGHDFRLHRDVARYEYDRTVFSQCPRQRQRKARRPGGKDRRNDDSIERLPFRCPQGFGGFFDLFVKVFQCRLKRPHYKRQADEC